MAKRVEIKVGDVLWAVDNRYEVTAIVDGMVECIHSDPYSVDHRGLPVESAAQLTMKRAREYKATRRAA